MASRGAVLAVHELLRHTRPTIDGKYEHFWGNERFGIAFQLSSEPPSANRVSPITGRIDLMEGSYDARLIFVVGGTREGLEGLEVVLAAADGAERKGTLDDRNHTVIRGLDPNVSYSIGINPSHLAGYGIHRDGYSGS